MPCKPLFGIEQEFYVFREGNPVDFRTIIHQLGIDGVRTDPGDANAYRCTEGFVLTADGTEAEFATPPVAIEQGFIGSIEAWTGRAERHLRHRLAPTFELRGASTHLNISIPDHEPDQLALDCLSTIAPALMLLWEPNNAHGLFVRPRPGRLEFCGEFIQGPRLATVSAFLVAAVIHLSREPRTFPRVAARPRAAAERYGYELRRHAFGPDLYELGRSAPLRSSTGASVSAGDHLKECWQVVKTVAGEFASQSSIRMIDSIVAGDLPLAGEGDLHVTHPEPPCGQLPGWPTTPPLIRRNGFAARPIAETWDLAVFRIEGCGSHVFATVGRTNIEQFSRDFTAGSLDRALHSSLHQPSDLPVLRGRPESPLPTLYRQLPNLRDLVPAEREPSRLLAQLGEGAFATSQASARADTYSRGVNEVRPGKFVTSVPVLHSPVAAIPPPVSRQGNPPWLLFGGGTGVIAILVAILLTWLLAGGEDPPVEPADDEPAPPTASATLGGDEPAPTTPATDEATPTPPQDPGEQDEPSPTALPEEPTQPAAVPTQPEPSEPTPTLESQPTQAPTETPQPTPAPPTPTTVPNAVPVVSALGAVLTAPITTYSIEAFDPDGDPLFYSWRIEGEPCGVPTAPGPLQGSGASTTWSHSNDQGCAHAAPDHPVTVFVTVIEAGIPRWQCNIKGSNTQSIPAPACVPLNQ